MITNSNQIVFEPVCKKKDFCYATRSIKPGNFTILLVKPGIGRSKVFSMIIDELSKQRTAIDKHDRLLIINPIITDDKLCLYLENEEARKSFDNSSYHECIVENFYEKESKNYVSKIVRIIEKHLLKNNDFSGIVITDFKSYPDIFERNKALEYIFHFIKKYDHDYPVVLIMQSPSKISLSSIYGVMLNKK